MVKDIVVEEDLNPEVDKPGRRMRLDAARNTSVEKEMPDIDWDKESVPLVPTLSISKSFTQYIRKKTVTRTFPPMYIPELYPV